MRELAISEAQDRFARVVELQATGLIDIDTSKAMLADGGHLIRWDQLKTSEGSEWLEAPSRASHIQIVLGRVHLLAEPPEAAQR
jgi:hypothetical protein